MSLEATPDDDMETTVPRPRRAWLAALLSLFCGPLGQVYVGHLRRSVLLLCAGALLLPFLVLSAISLPIGRSGIALLIVGLLAFPVYLAVDAWQLARRKRDACLKSYQRWYVYLLLYFVFSSTNYTAARVTRAYVAEAFVVPTRAMAPTIHAGDRILVDKLWSSPQRLQRHDVVVFRSEGPGTPLYVMRAIGLPGDRIEIENELVLINGEAKDDVHAVFNGPLPAYLDLANYGPTTIPSDCFFVLGDNRRLSKDSRILGPIPLSDFYGTVRLIYYSRVRTFPDPYDTSRYELGPMRWDRIGARLD